MLTLAYVAIGLICTIFILILLGRYTFWLPHRSWRIPRIVMLHQVTPLSTASGMNMPPEKFEKLLQLLHKKKCQFVTISELTANPLTPFQVALTFDDGFADNYEYAFPLLLKYQAKATIYIAPEIANIEKLSREQIDEMTASGLIEFGAHSVHHVNLTTLDDEQALQEIQQSRDMVINMVGSCHSFAYPFGRFSDRHQAMVKSVGFTSAVSTRKKIEPVSLDNLFCLPRVSTSGQMSMLQMKIALATGRYKL